MLSLLVCLVLAQAHETRNIEAWYLKHSRHSLARVAQWVECIPLHQEVAVLRPSGHMLGWGWGVYRWQLIDGSLSWCFCFSLPLPSSLSQKQINENIFNKYIQKKMKYSRHKSWWNLLKCVGRCTGETWGFIWLCVQREGRWKQDRNPLQMAVDGTGEGQMGAHTRGRWSSALGHEMLAILDVSTAVVSEPKILRTSRDGQIFAVWMGLDNTVCFRCPEDVYSGIIVIEKK